MVELYWSVREVRRGGGRYLVIFEVEVEYMGHVDRGCSDVWY
jgi:hypothetical protein